MSSYRVLLADPHSQFRQGLRRILEEKPDIEVTGEARDSFEMVSLIRFGKAAPHMIILDPSMNLRGTQSIRELKATYPDIKVLILSLHKDKEYLNQAISQGAEGYLFKDDVSNELLPAIETIRQGRIYVPPFP